MNQLHNKAKSAPQQALLTLLPAIDKLQHDEFHDTTNSTLQFLYRNGCKPMATAATTPPANPIDYNRT